MTDLALRTFKVFFESPSGVNGNTIVLDKDVHAAYYQQGFGRDAKAYDGDAFIVFKDCDHKPVYSVRAASVLSVEEIRSEPAAVTINVSGSVISDDELATIVRNAVRCHTRGSGPETGLMAA